MTSNIIIVAIGSQPPSCSHLDVIVASVLEMLEMPEMPDDERDALVNIEQVIKYGTNNRVRL